MIKKSILKMTLAVFSLILLAGIDASAQQQDCTTPNDKAIVKAIYKKMKLKYGKQIRHINVRSKEGVVTLEGWITTETGKAAIEKYAMSVKCVKSVENNLHVGLRTGCGPGQKKCGSICIGLEETCNICTSKTCL